MTSCQSLANVIVIVLLFLVFRATARFDWLLRDRCAIVFRSGQKHATKARRSICCVNIRCVGSVRDPRPNTTTPSKLVHHS